MSIELTLVAMIKCHSCRKTSTYKDDAEGVSVGTFSQDAKEHFESIGWVMFGTIKCPKCSMKQS